MDDTNPTPPAATAFAGTPDVPLTPPISEPVVPAALSDNPGGAITPASVMPSIIPEEETPKIEPVTLDASGSVVTAMPEVTAPASVSSVLPAEPAMPPAAPTPPAALAIPTPAVSTPTEPIAPIVPPTPTAPMTPAAPTVVTPIAATAPMATPQVAALVVAAPGLPAVPQENPDVHA